MRAKLRSVGTAALAGLIAGGMVIGSPVTAQAAPSASEPDQKVSGEVITAVVPGTNTVVTAVGVRSASITLPGSASSSSSAKPGNIPASLFTGVGEPVLTTTLKDAVISSYSTGKGTQTLINIGSSSASHEYRFPLSIPAGSKAAVEADGSVAVRTIEGEVVGGFKVPWAYDANGNPVPTKFSLEGDSLVQSVSFDEKTAFPVVADPSDFFGWTKCIATVGLEAAANGVVAIKITKLVARFGSVQRAFEVLFRAWNAASGVNKWQAVVAAGGGVAGEILGVTSIKEACFDF